jgi:chemotaxis protein CheD
MMHEEVLLIGEVKVFQDPVVMKCYGLGSCIGLFVKDRLTGICGGAHIFLPGNTSSSQNVCWNSLVTTLLRKMKSQGSDLSYLRAKLVGGANMFRNGFDVGAINIRTVTEELIQNKVFIAASDLGGNVSRTVVFDTATESLAIKSIETKQTKII